MEEKHLVETWEIEDRDWQETPVAVKRLVVCLGKELEKLKQQIQELTEAKELLEEKANRRAHNSSMAPSNDLSKSAKRKKKEKGEPSKKRGGQPGHPGHSRFLYPVEECDRVTDYYPQSCSECGEHLTGSDSNPYRHQVVEIPPIQLHIEEHRLHQLVCSHCGHKTRASLPEGVETSGYTQRVVAIVSLLSGMYRHSQRMVVAAMSDFFGVKMSVGSVNRLRTEASKAVAMPVTEAQAYVQQQSIVGADETGFRQGNADGNNGLNKKAWLWVALTPLVSFFQVMLSRSTEAAQSLLGKNFGGILNCDRYSAYNWLDVSHRQLCWAHLKREFSKISERSGVAGELGQALLAEQKKLFEFWHRVRDGTLTRTEFIEAVSPIRETVRALLQQGADYQIGSREKTPLAKTVRTCRQLLKVEPGLWLFVTVEGLEPTNNAAERAIRPAVLWRRTSFGSQSEAGSTFVARMLTVVTTLRSQNRNVLEYMTVAIAAARSGQSAPSLLPETTVGKEDLKVAA